MANLKSTAMKLINSIMPKNNKKMVFMSVPDYSDNAKVFFEYINNNYKDEYELIWLVEDINILDKLRSKGIKAYSYRSKDGLLSILTSKYLITTHGQQIYKFKSNKQIYINLWHGMPMKNIGFLEVDHSNYEEKENDLNVLKIFREKMDYFISTSKIMRLAMSTCFNVEPSKGLIVGQPRNDSLFNKVGKSILKDIGFKNIDSYEKIIFYLPTFRSGYGRSEGSINLSNILNMKEYSEEELNNYLLQNNYLLLVKLHPAEESNFKSDNHSNISIIDSNILKENLLGLNDILNVADLLITDYSSVYFDYLVLDRPILFINADEEQYMKSRGFIFDDPDFFRPGPKVDNLDSLTKEAYELLNNSNYYKKERDQVNSLVNTYKDGECSKRIYENIF